MTINKEHIDPKNAKRDPTPVFDESHVTSFRVQFGLWKAAKIKCMVEGKNLSDQIELFLTGWIEPEYITLAKRAVESARGGAQADGGEAGPGQGVPGTKPRSPSSIRELRRGKGPVERE